MARKFMNCCGIVEVNRKSFLKRTAKYAPQLLADGLSYGVSSAQGNLVHGMFDDVGSTSVDPFADISSDKFDLMGRGVEPQQMNIPGDDNQSE